MIQIRQIKTNVQAGKYDPLLAKVYCRPGSELDEVRSRICRIADGFLETFALPDTAEAAIFSAPGRTELGGNHTDHQGGKVLTGAVDLDAAACAAPNGTDIVRVYSEGYGLISLDCGRAEPQEAEQGTTAALIRGVVSGFRTCGALTAEHCGFDAYVSSGVPGGSGLSSSACFEVLTGTIVNGLFCGNSIGAEEIAKIGQTAENRFFGKPSGLLDQMGCALGGIAAIDFRHSSDPAVHPVRFDFSKAGYALCIIDTGGDHSGLTADYAAVPSEMKKVAAALGKQLLSEVSEDEFYGEYARLRREAGDRAVLRAAHYFAECRRVEEEVQALEGQDFARFLELVNESGSSSFRYLQNIDTYRDPAHQAVAAALAAAEHFLKGKGACRVHGGGFAGTIQAFVPLSEAEEFRKNMDRILGQGACRLTQIRPVGGITLIGGAASSENK